MSDRKVFMGTRDRSKKRKSCISKVLRPSCQHLSARNEQSGFKKDLIDEAMYAQLKGLGGFRNILAHEYMQISDQEVFRHFNKMVEMIDSIIDSFEKIID